MPEQDSESIVKGKELWTDSSELEGGEAELDAHESIDDTAEPPLSTPRSLAKDLSEYIAYVSAIRKQ